MKILENYIAPTEHSQGDVGDIWIDKSTGDVYKCTGLTGSAKDLGYIAIGADSTNTKYIWKRVDNWEEALLEDVTKTKTITWDGDMTGKVTVDGSSGDYFPMTFVKVAEYIPSEKVIPEYERDEIVVESNYWLYEQTYTEVVVGVSVPCVISKFPFDEMSPLAFYVKENIEFTESGIYFLHFDSTANDGGIWYLEELSYNEESTVIDPVLLPKADAVADVTSAPTAEQFNALLASLRAAGYLEK